MERFTLMAPHVLEKDAWTADLEDLPFSGMTFLVRMLTVPVSHKNCPKQKAHIQPQTMSEDTLIRPRDTSKDAYHNVTFGVCDEAIETEFTSMESKPIKRKAVVETLMNSPQRLHKALKRESTMLNSETHTILSLPTELHHKVFDHLDDLEDVVSLGLVNRHFCKLAPEHVHSRIAEGFGRWANEALVCVGDDIELDDFPPGLSLRVQLRAINEELGAEAQDSDPMPLSLQELAEYSQISVGPQGSYEVERMIEHFSTWPEITDVMLENVGLPMSPNDWDNYFPRDQPWILRNLTTKEFVRAEAIAISQEHIHGPALRIVGFGEAVITRICWSSSGNGIEGAPNICRGPWAGHRFDITTLARHQEEIGDGEEWTDASDEVAKEMDTIWRSNFGEDWRRTLPKDLEDLPAFTW